MTMMTQVFGLDLPAFSAFTTVTEVAAESAPSAVVAVILAVPTFRPVTSPVAAMTDATEVSTGATVHDTAEVGALGGLKAAESCSLDPTTKLGALGVTFIVVGTAAVTTTVVVAVMSPRLTADAVTVTVAVPTPFAVTTPVGVTEATVDKDDDHDHVTGGYGALTGVIAAVSVEVFPTTRLRFWLDNAIPITVTSAVAVIPSAVVAVIVVVPELTDTTATAFGGIGTTLATSGLAEENVASWVAVDGDIVATIFHELFLSRSSTIEVGANIILVPAAPNSLPPSVLPLVYGCWNIIRKGILY
jgi:hypothetical protein